MNLTLIGDRVAQLKGTPIGGFLSKMACSLVLINNERQWDDSGHTVWFHLPHGMSWSDAVALVRYADDTIMVSRLFCEECLEAALNAMSPVKLDVACRGASLHWLDLIVDLTVDGGSVDIFLKPYATPPVWASTVWSTFRFFSSPGIWSRSEFSFFPVRSSPVRVLNLVRVFKPGPGFEFFRSG